MSTRCVGRRQGVSNEREILPLVARAALAEYTAANARFPDLPLVHKVEKDVIIDGYRNGAKAVYRAAEERGLHFDGRVIPFKTDVPPNSNRHERSANVIAYDYFPTDVETNFADLVERSRQTRDAHTEVTEPGWKHFASWTNVIPTDVHSRDSEKFAEYGSDPLHIDFLAEYENPKNIDGTDKFDDYFAETDKLLESLGGTFTQAEKDAHLRRNAADAHVQRPHDTPPHLGVVPKKPPRPYPPATSIFTPAELEEQARQRAEEQARQLAEEQARQHAAKGKKTKVKKPPKTKGPKPPKGSKKPKLPKGSKKGARARLHRVTRFVKDTVKELGASVKGVFESLQRNVTEALRVKRLVQEPSRSRRGIDEWQRMWPGREPDVSPWQDYWKFSHWDATNFYTKRGWDLREVDISKTAMPLPWSATKRHPVDYILPWPSETDKISEEAWKLYLKYKDIVTGLSPETKEALHAHMEGLRSYVSLDFDDFWRCAPNEVAGLRTEGNCRSGPEWKSPTWGNIPHGIMRFTTGVTLFPPLDDAIYENLYPLKYPAMTDPNFTEFMNIKNKGRNYCSKMPNDHLTPPINTDARSKKSWDEYHKLRCLTDEERVANVGWLSTTHVDPGESRAWIPLELLEDTLGYQPDVVTGVRHLCHEFYKKWEPAVLASATCPEGRHAHALTLEVLPWLQSHVHRYRYAFKALKWDCGTMREQLLAPFLKWKCGYSVPAYTCEALEKKHLCSDGIVNMYSEFEKNLPPIKIPEMLLPIGNGVGATYNGKRMAARYLVHPVFQIRWNFAIRDPAVRDGIRTMMSWLIPRLQYTYKNRWNSMLRWQAYFSEFYEPAVRKEKYPLEW